MVRKWFKYLICLFVVAIFFNVSGGYAVDLENLDGSKPHHPTEVIFTPNLSSVKGTVITGRAEFSDAFERADIAPWTNTGSNYNWGIRDTTNTYGPQTPSDSGYRYAGIPQNDISGYAGNRNGQLTSPTIDITGWGVLYISFNYWADLEPDNFDGMEIQISPDNGTTWLQVDSLAESHLNPTYDGRCVGIPQVPFGTDYIYHETTDGWVNVVSQDLISLGYVSPGNQVKVMFWFGSDPAFNAQGVFVDDVRIADSPPPDLQPPLIAHTPLTDTLLTHTQFTISGVVTDDGDGLDTDSVYLVYNIEKGPWVYVQMTNTAGDTFEAGIPGQVYHTDIYYYIEAADLATPPNIGVTEEYLFEVTTARIIIYDDGQPWWSQSDLMPGSGLFQQFMFDSVGIDSGFLHKILFKFDGDGGFDLCVYEWATFQPGALIDSMAGLDNAVQKYGGFTVWDLDTFGIKIYGPMASVLVGFLARTTGPDTTRHYQDPTMEFPWAQWGWIDNAWQQTPYSGGDLMMRLKVIPLPLDSDTFAIQEIPIKPQKPAFWLYQNRPNPMVNSSVIEFQVSTVQHVSLQIYNVAGQLIKTLIHDTKKDIGTHRVYWNGRDDKGQSVANGIYFYQLKGETETLTRKMVITR